MSEAAGAWVSALVLGVLACACGPTKSGADGTGSGGESTAAEATSAETTTAGEASAASSSTSASASDSSTGAPDECPGNAANEPLCYRKFSIAWDGDDLVPWYGPPTARVGNFGPNGEEAFLLSGWDAGTPMALAFWNGDGFDVQPWGVVPALDSSYGRIPIRFFDGIHADLAIGSSSVLAVAPWTPDGPGEPVVVEPPPTGFIVSLFRQQPVLDVEGDGREEIAVSYEDGLVGWMEHYLVGNVDGAPAFFGPVIQHQGSCGSGVVGLAPGHLDGDAFVDLAEIGPCEVRNLDGAFAFAAEWGDGTGAFEPVGVPFSATSPTTWLGVGDFDGDGFDDVVIALDDGITPGYEAYLEVHRSRGDRMFDPPMKVWTDESAPGGYPDGGPASNMTFILGDVDGDGTDDFIFKYFMVALVDVLGEQQTLEMFDVAWKHNEVEVVSAFDLNHDGRLDFIVDDEVAGVYAFVSS